MRALIAISTGAIIYSCEKETSEPELTTQSQYDAAYLYLENVSPPLVPYEAAILAIREYEYNNQDITDSATRFAGMQTYLDTRLNELFPDIVYPGFMDDMQVLYENFKIMNSIEKNLDTLDNSYSNPNDLSGYQPFDSLYQKLHYDEMDAEFPSMLSLTNYLRDLDSLSQRNYSNRASLQELIDLASNYNLGGSGSGKVTLAPWTSYFVLVNPINWVRGVAGIFLEKKDREFVAKMMDDPNYFGGHVNQSPSNAFKHILTAMLYRTNYSAAASDFAMWQHEWYGGNQCLDLHMDLHNNDVGGWHKYYSFRKPWTTWWWKRKKFAERVRDYVKDENNGVYVNGAYLWDEWKDRTDLKGSQDCKDCKDDRKNKRYGITKKKYIYLKP